MMTSKQHGVFVGIKDTMDGALVLTEDGARRARSMRRLPVNDRHDFEFLEKVKGTPWRPNPESGEATIMPAGMRIVPENDVPIVMPRPAVVEKPPKRMYIRAGVELKKYGYTEGCPACKIMQQGARHSQRRGLNHSEECRTRIEAAMEEDTDQDAKDRLTENREKYVTAAAEAVAEYMEKQHSAAKAVPAAAEADPTQEIREEGRALKRRNVSSEEHTARGDKRKAAEIELEKIAVEHEERGTKRPAEGPGDDERLDREEPPMTGGSSGSGGHGPTEDTQMDNISAMIKEAFDGDVTDEDSRAMAIDLLEMNAIHVAEMYSPPRLTADAPAMGLTGGFAMDLETGWELSDHDQWARAKEELEEQRPKLLVGSPPCDPWSALQNFNFPKMNEEKIAAIQERGELHLNRALEMYEKQYDNGGLFLHEHPWTARSWKHPRLADLARRHGVYIVKGPMCNYHMMSEDAQGPGLVRKDTGWMTNSARLAERLVGVCANKLVDPDNCGTDTCTRSTEGPRRPRSTRPRW